MTRKIETQKGRGAPTAAAQALVSVVNPAGTTAIAARPAGKANMTKIMGKGFENLSREDILLPRILLLQAQSPQVMEADERPGTFYLNLSNKGLGEKFVITPILHYRSRIKWVPRDDGGGIDCSAQDAKRPSDTKYAAACADCKFKDWNDKAEKKKDQQPECVMYDNFVVLLGNETEPVILSMSKSSAKVAKKFYSMAALKGGNFFDHAYELSIVKEKAPTSETYYNYAVKDIGRKTDEKRRVICDQIWGSLSNATVRGVMEHPEGEAGASGGERAPY